MLINLTQPNIHNSHAKRHSRTNNHHPTPHPRLEVASERVRQDQDSARISKRG